MPDFQNTFFGIRYQYSYFHTQLLNDPSQFSKNYYNEMEVWGGINLSRKVRILAFVPYYQNKQVDDVGGVMYLTELWEAVPTGANAEYHANLVRDAAQIRGLIHASNEILRDAYDRTQSGDELVAQAERKIMEVAKGSLVGEVIPLGEVVTHAFERLDSRIGKDNLAISGMATGAGMIAPDMATMLAYIFTDAALPPAVLQPLLAAAADRSFNCMTVDGDTSTSDTVLLCATQQASHHPVTSAADRRLDDFRRALDAVMIDLAQQIARDGEGATKFVTIEVTGAATDRAARRIGLSIANSPLVKTALSAGDPNWGRIVMAVGKAGEKIDPEQLAISIGGIPIAAAGGPVPGYDEAPVAEYMKRDEITIAVDIGIGQGEATVWTCDLTHGYIDINASYRS